MHSSRFLPLVSIAKQSKQINFEKRRFVCSLTTPAISQLRLPASWVPKHPSPKEVSPLAPHIVFRRFAHVSPDPSIDVDIETVQDVITGAAEPTVLIDVRRASELKDEGDIPTAKHIPLKELVSAFQLDEPEFVEKYHFERPSQDQPIIFFCKGGIRSHMAVRAAESLGYTAKHFPGGHDEWLERHPKKQ